MLSSQLCLFAFVFSPLKPLHPAVLPKITSLLRAQYLVFDLFKTSLNIMLSAYICFFRIKRQKQVASNFCYTEKGMGQAVYSFHQDSLLFILYHENIDSAYDLETKGPQNIRGSLTGWN